MSQNQQVMKQALKDANIYEDNMSEEMVTSFYKAIKESEESATELLNRGTFDESVTTDSQPHESTNEPIFNSFNKSEMSVAELQNKSMNDSVNELLTAMNDSENISPSLRERLTNETKKVFTPKQWARDQNKSVLATKRPEKEETTNNNISGSDTDAEPTEKESSNEWKVIEDDDEIFSRLKYGDSKVANSFASNLKNVNHNDDEVFLRLKCSGTKVTNSVANKIKNMNNIGFNDMPEETPRNVFMQKNLLKFHEFKRINIQNSKKFLASNSDERIQMLFKYHIALDKIRGRVARQSRIPAPLPKAITTTGNSQDQDNPVHQSVAALREDEKLEGFTEYVSRSGRHTKRKVYCEEDSQDKPISSPKKSKAANDNDASMSKGSVRGSKLPKKGDTVSSTTNNNNDKDFVLDADENKPRRPLGRSKSGGNKTPSNDEIMQRCNTLFGDSPGRKRAGALVSAGIEEENRRKKDEERMETFSKSLDVVNEESEDVISLDDEQVETDEVPFVPKRVVAPIPYKCGRKPINNRKRKQQDGVGSLDITTAKRPANSISSSDDVSESQSVNGNGNNSNGTKRTAVRKNSNDNIERSEASSSTSKGGRGGRSSSDMVTCPVCSVGFPKRDIEEHAATCGEELVTQSTPKHPISCPVCDMLIVESAKYDEHVDNCRRQQRNSK